MVGLEAFLFAHLGHPLVFGDDEGWDYDEVELDPESDSTADNGTAETVTADPTTESRD
jgi:hypothetical protein